MGGAVLGLVLLLAPLAASGAETPVLTLQQLTVMALNYSPEVKATKSEVTLAQEQKNEAHAYRWPQFDAVATGGVVPNARRGQVRQVGEDKTLFYPDPKDKLHGMNIFGNLTFALVQPLSTFGKIVGGGLPLGAFGGRREVMGHLADPRAENLPMPTFVQLRVTNLCNLRCKMCFDYGGNPGNRSRHRTQTCRGGCRYSD
jgi:hypothetical protein